MRALRTFALSLLFLVGAAVVSPEALAVPTDGGIFTIGNPNAMTGAGYDVNNQTHACPDSIGGCGPKFRVDPNPDWSRNHVYDADYFWTWPGWCTSVSIPSAGSPGGWWFYRRVTGGSTGKWSPVDRPWILLLPYNCSVI